MKKKPFLERLSEIILNEQTWILLIFLIPLSLLYDVISYILFIYDRIAGMTFQTHEDKIKDVQRQVRKRLQTKDKRPMCTSRPGWKSITFQKLIYKSKCYQINVNMSSILYVDTSRRKVMVEPLIDIGTLNDYLINLGWTLPIVPELDELTIGGLVMGGGIESTSNKYGLFQYICSKYELVIPDGSLVTSSPTQKPELYCSIPFCYGTLGLLTAVEIDIIPYKPFVKLTYTPKQNLNDYVEEFSKVIQENKVK
ncbi:DHCR24 [Lepeophtheirus salmonis]|uniref:DHCR24 n=1 Tax=Lepeophtheirus salmonis TaxID=72036 RepID=A0A7R8H138_LEPSM|nr:DHCR24 [Lepeophtheirus salmonis]CAF2803933.1 DHCR24 [Lepeophtheirus salmonis]